MKPKTNAESLPEGVEILIGPRGSKYYLRNGRKVYLNKRRRIRSDNKYTAPRGAFSRYLKNQHIIN